MQATGSGSNAGAGSCRRSRDTLPTKASAPLRARASPHPPPPALPAHALQPSPATSASASAMPSTRRRSRRRSAYSSSSLGGRQGAAGVLAGETPRPRCRGLLLPCDCNARVPARRPRARPTMNGAGARARLLSPAPPLLTYPTPAPTPPAHLKYSCHSCGACLHMRRPRCMSARAAAAFWLASNSQAAAYVHRAAHPECSCSALVSTLDIWRLLPVAWQKRSQRDQRSRSPLRQRRGGGG